MKIQSLIDGQVDGARHKAATYAIYRVTREQYSLGNISLKRTNNVIGGMLGAAPNAWRVVGITPDALRLFHEVGFREKPKGIQRAHLISRIETIRELIERPEPFEENALFKHWEAKDRTILCLSRENRTITERQHHEISNPDGAFFTNAYIGYTFRRDREGKLVETLWQSQGT